VGQDPPDEVCELPLPEVTPVEAALDDDDVPDPLVEVEVEVDVACSAE
jgi:hypothetical protein